VYKIEFLPASERELERLAKRAPLEDYETSEATIDGLVENPRPHNATKLVGEERAYRLRVGQYRIIYEILDDELAVVITKVARWSETTYRRR